MDLTLLLTLGLSAPLLWFGAVTEPGLVAALVASAAMAVAVIVEQPFAARSTRVRRVSWALTGLVLYEGFTLLPLPPTLLGWLAPTNAAIWAANDLALGKALRWHSLSVDPSQTRFALATVLSAALWFDVISRICVREEGRRSVLHAVSAACTFVALLGLAHIAFGLTLLYGVVPIGQITIPTTGMLTPLLNPNHASALLGVAPAVLTGLILGVTKDHGLGYRTMAGLCCAFAAAMAILTLSRGGMAVLAVETIGLSIYAWSRRDGVRSRTRWVLGLVSIVACVLGAVFAIGAESVAREASDLSLSKLAIIGRAFRMSAESPWFGVGRGAFASTFSAHTGVLPFETVFSHVESWPVQLGVELGWPVTLIFIAVIGHALITVLPSALARPLTAGALFALLGLAIHDLVDFSMEFAGVGAIASALLAVVLSAPTILRSSASTATSNQASASSAVPRGRRMRFVGATAALAAAGIVLLLPTWKHRLQDDVDRMYAAWSKGPLDAIAGDIVASMARHPAEPTFPMLEGVRRSPSPEATPYLVHAVRLGPYRAHTHFWLARWLAAHQLRGQAWVEYKQAARLDHRMQNAVFEELARLGAPLEELAPDSLSFEQVGMVRHALLVSKRTDDADQLDEWIIERHPPAAEARARRVDRLVANKDLPAAQREAEKAVELAPGAWETHASLARALEAAGQPERAEGALERGLFSCPTNVELSELLVRIRGQRLGLAAIEREVSGLRSALELSGSDPARFHIIMADVELRRNRPLLAIQNLVNAARVAVEPTPILKRAVELAEANSAWSQAEAIWSRLGDIHPEQPDYRSSAQRAHQRSALVPSALVGGL